MTFNYTEEKSAKYLVILYGWNFHDRYIYHYYRDALIMFNSLKEKIKDGDAVSIYDLQKDIRKAYFKK